MDSNFKLSAGKKIMHGRMEVKLINASYHQMLILDQLGLKQT